LICFNIRKLIQVEQSKGNPFFVLLKQTNAFAYTYVMHVENHKLHKHVIIYNTKILKQWTENSVTFCFFKCSICMPCFGKVCPSDIFLEENIFMFFQNLIYAILIVIHVNINIVVTPWHKYVVFYG